ncbi:MAG: PD-(D/E)XK nuclease family transposase [Agathobacter sp.]|nr:PD-(D/E)XK nuclease family transposase [Agathobacter sp.]
MEQKTTLSQSIDIVEQKAQYDEACKKVLAEKIILAWIMRHTMKEYADYDVQEIVEKFIVGEPKVAETKVLPDETNAPKITGTGIEDSTMTEGSVTYDIQFRAIMPDSKEVVQMIINVEAQNDFYPGYPIIKRGIYYCARMISAQYGTVFTKSHYEKIQKVYSVWICTNPPKERSNTITEYSLTEKHHVGKVKETKEYYDLMSAIMVCLGKNEDETEHELLKLLDVLLSPEKKAQEKKEVLEKEFDIPMTEKMETEVTYMCNLSDGVEQRGIEKGIEETKRTTVINMLKENDPIDKICRVAECDESYVKKVQDELATNK